MRRVRLALLVIGTTTLLASPAAADDAASAPPPADVRLIRGKPLAEWVRALHHDDQAVRAAASEALGDAGPGAADVLPALHSALNESDPKAHDAAFQALLRVDPNAQTSLRMFLADLHNPEPSMRIQGGWGLDQISEAQPQAVMAAMTDALHDESVVVRVMAVDSIGGFGSKASPAVPALIEALHDENDRVRREAARALPRLGLAARGAVGPLCNALRDPDNDVRLMAYLAVCDIGGDPKVAIPIVFNNLKDPDVNVRYISARLLVEMKWGAAAAIGPLCDAMLHGEEFRCRVRWRSTRSDAALVLRRIGPEAKAAVPALLLALQDDSKDVREAAADALKQIDPDTATHVLNPP